MDDLHDYWEEDLIENFGQTELLCIPNEDVLKAYFGRFLEEYTDEYTKTLIDNEHTFKIHLPYKSPISYITSITFPKNWTARYECNNQVMYSSEDDEVIKEDKYTKTYNFFMTCSSIDLRFSISHLVFYYQPDGMSDDPVDDFVLTVNGLFDKFPTTYTEYNDAVKLRNTFWSRPIITNDKFPISIMNGSCGLAVMRTRMYFILQCVKEEVTKRKEQVRNDHCVNIFNKFQYICAL